MYLYPTSLAYKKIDALNVCNLNFRTTNSYIRQKNSALKYRIILSSILMT
ncbi:hypothetical protein VCHA35O141_20300 [Vibrio chagasii]|nr:hypothetical protein VCHA35O143_10166 [Vibrio chagasii]CAH6842811.1 hypothetical protein VCHA31O73_10374 [Vibrio chagasii]CAH6887229.1 hypothetical protein VCHA35O141_20300 [Vibrio chagasii]CAH7061971.1 hypothetical protein VCHA53O480_10301 [Vibrio chagasii]CAH7099551.1 hypothetical protein VCHA50O396_10240 [Vibrio chagasii]